MTEHYPIAPDQRDITYGSHWFSPVDLDRHLVDFGKVTADSELDRKQMIVGLLYSQVYNRLTGSEPRSLYVQRGHVWPIPEHLYVYVKAHGWDIRGFNAVERDAFSEVWSQWRSWVRMWDAKVPRRPFGEFVTEVENIALVAARDVSGAYLRHHRIADRHLVLRFSHWAAAGVAQASLNRAGLGAKHVGETALSVYDRSER